MEVQSSLQWVASFCHENTLAWAWEDCKTWTFEFLTFPWWANGENFGTRVFLLGFHKSRLDTWTLTPIEKYGIHPLLGFNLPLFLSVIHFGGI